MPLAPGDPTLRWSSQATTIPGIEHELARFWALPQARAAVDGPTERTIAARTSVLNLVVVARSAELGQRSASTISMLTGRHPSRTLILVPTDPDGPGWLRAQVRAYCMIPRADAPETCAEHIYATAGGATGRHLGAIVAPLLVHDLPVTLWWPGEPPFGTPLARDLIGMADRLVMDGPSWAGDGLERLRGLAARRAGARPLRPSSTTPSSCPTSARCAASQSPTGPMAGLTQRPARTLSSRSTTLPGLPRGWASAWSDRWSGPAGPDRPGVRPRAPDRSPDAACARSSSGTAAPMWRS